MRNDPSGRERRGLPHGTIKPDAHRRGHNSRSAERDPFGVVPVGHAVAV